MAMDMFCETAQGAAAVTASTGGSPTKVASADGDGESKAPESLLDISRRQKGEGIARPWKIPSAVERGFEIPIAITDTFAVPELGKFRGSSR